VQVAILTDFLSGALKLTVSVNFYRFAFHGNEQFDSAFVKVPMKFERRHFSDPTIFQSV
jgi:hypothetical protein